MNEWRIRFGLTGPDLHDDRDRYKSPEPRGGIEPVDLSDDLEIRPTDQGDTNSCVGHAAAKLSAACMSKTGIGKGIRFSALDLYAAARSDLDTDRGTSLRSGAMACVRHGAAPGSIWPSDTDPRFPPETRRSYPQDRRYYLPEVERLADAEKLLRVLSLERVPVLTGIALQDAATDEMLRTGFAPRYDPDDSVIGHHAEIAVGWDRFEGREWIKWCGSWGRDAGEGGYYWRPLEYVENGTVMDMWTVGKKFF